MGETKECAVCRAPFEAKSRTHRFCSVKCRWEASNAAKSGVTFERIQHALAWDPVRAAASVRIRTETYRMPKPWPVPAGWERTVVLPDPQFGYWRDGNGELHPVHDEHALAIARQVTIASGARNVVWLGDMLDLPEFSRYQQTAAFVQTAQPAIDRCYKELRFYHSQHRRQVILSGNHDERLHKAIATNLLAAAGLRRAANPEDWPALSVPVLLRLEEMGIQYIGAHPAGAFWINDNVVCVHGRWLGTRTRRAVVQALEDERVTVIFGHTHRLEMAVKTRSLRDRPAYHAAWAAGCLCRIDGAVPSTRGGYRAGQRGPVRAWEDWQQGLLVVTAEPGDGRFLIEPVFIFENQPAYWRDHEFTGLLG